MRTLDVLRHTMRRKPGQHLSHDGVALARLVAASRETVALAVTSTVPRAIETAIAMGYEVTEEVAALSLCPREVFDALSWPNSLAHIGAVVAQSRTVAVFAAAQAALWSEIAARVPDGQTGLIVSHGGLVELGAVAALPGADFGRWGDAIG